MADARNVDTRIANAKTEKAKLSNEGIEKRQYRLGHAVIELQIPKGMLIPKNLEKFSCERKSIDQINQVYQISYVNSLMKVEQKIRREFSGAIEIRRDTICVLCSAERECRILNFQGARRPYGISVEENDSFNKVWLDREIAPMLMYETIFLSLLSLEKLMLRCNAMILHSAYMDRGGKAVLFSAPSETGKSTQADLWEKYRGTRTVNGDRSLLIREQDGWHAYGWPVCGSSGICHNEEHPVQAIVMLHQAKDNQIRELSGFEAVQKLMSQITINMWNTEFQMKIMDMIEKLISEIPLYELGCNISEEAVECLEMVL